MINIFKKIVIVLIIIFVWPLHVVMPSEGQRSVKLARSIREKTTKVYQKGLERIRAFHGKEESMRLQSELDAHEKAARDFYVDNIQKIQNKELELRKDVEEKEKYIGELDKTIKELEVELDKTIRELEAKKKKFSLKKSEKTATKDALSQSKIEQQNTEDALSQSKIEQQNKEKKLELIKKDIRMALKAVSESVMKLFPSSAEEHQDSLRILFSFIHRIVQAIYSKDIPFYGYVGVDEFEKAAAQERRQLLERQVKSQLLFVETSEGVEPRAKNQQPEPLAAEFIAHVRGKNVAFNEESIALLLMIIFTKPIAFDEWYPDQFDEEALLLTYPNEQLLGKLYRVKDRDDALQQLKSSMEQLEQLKLQISKLEDDLEKSTEDNVKALRESYEGLIKTLNETEFRINELKKFPKNVEKNEMLRKKYKEAFEEFKRIIDVLGRKELKEFAGKFDRFVNKKFYEMMAVKKDEFDVEQRFQVYELELGVLKNVVECLWPEFFERLKKEFDEIFAELKLAHDKHDTAVLASADGFVKKIQGSILKTIRSTSRQQDAFADLLTVYKNNLYPLFERIAHEKMMDDSVFRNDFQWSCSYQKSSDFINFLVITGFGFFLSYFLYERPIADEADGFLKKLLATKTIKPITYFFDKDFPVEVVGPFVHKAFDDMVNFIKGLKTLPLDLRKLHQESSFKEALGALSSYVYTFNAQRIIAVTHEIVYTWLLQKEPHDLFALIKELFDLIDTRGSLSESQRQDFAAAKRLLEAIVSAPELGNQIKLMEQFMGEAKDLSETQGTFVVAMLVYLCDRFHQEVDKAQVRKLFHAVVRGMLKYEWLSRNPLQMAFCWSLFLLTSDSSTVGELNKSLAVFSELVPLIQHEDEGGFVGIKGWVNKNFISWVNRLMVEVKSDGPLGFDKQYLNAVLSAVGILTTLGLSDEALILTGNLEGATASVTKAVNSFKSLLLKESLDENDEKTATTAMLSLIDLLSSAGSERNKRLLLSDDSYEKARSFIFDMLIEYPFLRNSELLGKAKVFFSQDADERYKATAAIIDIWRFVFEKSETSKPKKDIEKQLLAVVLKDDFDALYHSFLVEDKKRMISFFMSPLIDLDILRAHDVVFVYQLLDKIKEEQELSVVLEKSQPGLTSEIELSGAKIQQLQLQWESLKTHVEEVQQTIQVLTEQKETVLGKDERYKKAKEVVKSTLDEKERIKIFCASIKQMHDIVVGLKSNAVKNKKHETIDDDFGKDEVTFFERALESQQQFYEQTEVNALLLKESITVFLRDFEKVYRKIIGQYLEESVAQLGGLNRVFVEFDQSFSNLLSSSEYLRVAPSFMSKYLKEVRGIFPILTKLNIFDDIHSYPFFILKPTYFKQVIEKFLKNGDLLAQEETVINLLRAYNDGIEKIHSSLLEKLRMFLIEFNKKLAKISTIKVPSQLNPSLRDENLKITWQDLKEAWDKLFEWYKNLQRDSDQLFELVKTKIKAAPGMWENIERDLNGALQMVKTIEEQKAPELKQLDTKISEQNALFFELQSKLRMLQKSLEENENKVTQMSKQIEDGKEKMKKIKETVLPTLKRLLGIVENYDVVDRWVKQHRSD